MPLIDNSNLQQALTEFKDNLKVSPVYSDPMDVKDEHVVEYGYFTMSKNQTADLTVVKFDTVVENKNIEISASSNSIRLKKDKTYELESSVYVGYTGQQNSIFQFKDITNNKKIGTPINPFNVTNTSSRNSQHTTSLVYTPTSDCEVVLSIIEAPLTIYSDYSYLMIKEVSQPVVVEYNKYNEISNPLTTTDISQESPVGSVINYVGVNVPEHYLACDGSEYNISDYPHLAEHIRNEYGVYDCFGGDGKTNFGIPNITSDDNSIYCIKYEPTHYAVNQYGGFEQTILFDGNISSVGTYELTDSVDNYDMIYVLYEVGSSDNKDDAYGRVNAYFPSLQRGKHISIGHASGNSTKHYVFGIALFSANSLSIILRNMDGYTYYSIYKVIGIKGQLPSLLQGGEF